MTIIFILIGILWITCGIAIKYKKWLWIHQGLYKRPVDVDKYTGYMGIVDVIAGSTFVIFGLINLCINISSFAWLIFIAYCIFMLYGEIKYRIKQENQ